MNNPVVIKLPNGTHLLRSEGDNVWATRFGYEGMPVTTDPEIIAEDLESSLEGELIIGNERHLFQALIEELRLNVGMQKTIDKLRISSNQGESTRLRQYVITASKYRTAMSEAVAVWESMDSFDDPVTVIEKVISILKQAFSSSHREDGIQNALEIRQFYADHNDFTASNAIEEVLHALGITIQGTTEER